MKQHIFLNKDFDIENTIEHVLSNNSLNKKIWYVFDKAGTRLTNNKLVCRKCEMHHTCVWQIQAYGGAYLVCP